MGGHIVQGHVDTVAEIAEKREDGNAWVFRFKPRRGAEGGDVLRYIVEKGFIALDGASLTVTAVDDTEGWFEIMLIAYSQEKVVMMQKGVGDEVNVEIDLVGKLVEKSVGAYLEGKGGQEGAPAAILEKMVTRLVDEKLAKRS
jgi:riboflavin synthase